MTDKHPNRIWYVMALLLCLLLCGCSAVQEEAALPSPEPTLAATPLVQHIPVALVTPTPSPTPTPTPTPTPSPTPVPTPFTVVWMSDTQVYALRHADVFDAMAEWIVSSAETQNLRFVLHTGDVVDNGYSDKQWDTANAALERIQGALPMLVVAGNHDIGDSNNYSNFLRQPSIAATLDEERVFRRGEGAYALFSAGGVDFVAVGVGFSIKDGFYDWARDVFAAHPERVGILISHSALNSDGSFTGPGRRLSDYVVAESPNVRLVLCGHYRGAVLREETYGEGELARRVNFMMYNYQEDEKNGLGYLRLLTFDPVARSIQVTTYSPFRDDYDYDDPEKDTFLLADAF